MQRFRATSGPFEYQLRFSPEEIDDICLEALRQAGYLPQTPEPIRIDRFIEKHFTPNLLYEDLDPEILGYTAFNPDGSIHSVAVSSKLEDGYPASERRLRSTLAHEGGHCLMHPSLFVQTEEQTGLLAPSPSVSFKSRRLLCRNTDVDPGSTRQPTRRYDGRWWEWQANRAIGGLLLPKHLVMLAVEPFVKRALVTRAQSLNPASLTAAQQRVAEIFHVNPVVARIRLLEMFPNQSGSQLEF